MATIPRIAVALARFLIALARVVIRRVIGRPASQLDPVHLDLMGILIAIPRITPSRIAAAGHRVPLSESDEAIGLGGGQIELRKRDG
jgi:hypothetical protein